MLQMVTDLENKQTNNFSISEIAENTVVVASGLNFLVVKYSVYIASPSLIYCSHSERKTVHRFRCHLQQHPNVNGLMQAAPSSNSQLPFSNTVIKMTCAINKHHNRIVVIPDYKYIL